MVPSPSPSAKFNAVERSVEAESTGRGKNRPMTDASTSSPDVALIDDLNRRLRDLRAPLEEGFLAVGDRLVLAMDEVRGIEAAFAALAGSLESDSLGHTLEQLDKVGAGLSDLAAQGERQEASLKALDAKARDLAAPLMRLRKTTDEVRALAINARVEAAQIDGGSTDFTVFTVEMGRLADQAQAALERLGGELGRLQTMTSEAEGARRGFDHLQGDAFETVIRHVRSSVDRLGAHRRGIAAMAQSVGETSGRVGRQVAEVIGALQVGDITRQRVEHVEEALEAVRGGEDEVIASVSALQSLQLEAAADELERELTRVGDNLAGLRVETKGVRDRSRELFGGGAADSLEGMGERLRQAVELSGRCRAAEAELQDHLAPILQRLKEMLSHIETVRSIEADMRLMGLNATLKCGRLGSKGRTLAVIAQVLRAHAGRTAEDAQQVMRGLAEIADMARSVSSDGARGEDALHVALEGAVEVFGGIEAQFNRAREALATRAEQAGSLLDDCVGRLVPLGEARAGLAGCTAGLTALSSAHGGVSHLSGSGNAHAHLRQSYTMAGERDVHAQFLGERAGEGPVAQTLDDIFF